jgi:hypothetical protein
MLIGGVALHGGRKDDPPTRNSPPASLIDRDIALQLSLQRLGDHPLCHMQCICNQDLCCTASFWAIVALFTVVFRF